VKRIRMILASAFVAIAVTAAWAGPASAGRVDMHVTLTGLSPIANCDATMTTTGGPPPLAVSMVASSFAGQVGSANPCDPADIFVLNNPSPVNPSVSFTGFGPWTATVNRFALSDTFSGCSYPVTNLLLSSSATVAGPYGGAKTSPGSCFSPANVSLTNVTFYP